MEWTIIDFEMRSKSISLSRHFAPERIFIILGFLAGSLLAVFVPFGAGFDEETHLVRVYDLAGLHWLPNRSAGEGSYAPEDFYRLSYQRRALLTPAQNLLTGESFTKRIDRNNPMLAQTRSIYPPPALGVQAILARLVWLKYDFPVIPGTILLRLAGLGLYLLGGYLAIRITPTGNWLLVASALSPMALFQAATVNIDGFTYAVALLFIATALRLYANAPDWVEHQSVWLCVGAIFLLGVAKPGTIFLLPVLILLPLRRFRPRRLAAALWIAAGVSLVVTVGWNIAAAANSHFAAGGDQSIGQELELILADPLKFAVTFVTGAISTLPSTYHNWIGVYGHWAGSVPGLVYPLFMLALLLALAVDPPARWLRLHLRGLLMGTSLFAAGLILLMYFAANYTPGDANILGKQGRYLLPFAPLFFLGLAGMVDLSDERRTMARTGALAALVLCLSFYGYGLYATYYTVCGEMVYTGRACAQPVYMNLDKDNALGIGLREKSLVRQEFTNTCERLVGVDVLMRSLPVNTEGSLRLEALDPKGDLVALGVYSFRNLKAGEYVRLKMDLYPAVQGGRYVIQVLKPENEGVQLPEVAHNPDEIYPDGELWVNGEAVSGDLIFHYYCDLPGRVLSR